ncbi:acetate/propionate family kinase [Granulicella sibirica]|uniref:Acetate kinase n=1 Tax=Granulicella sibirica TaxID=2479048 RepID=A0A4Q0T3N7_9BACT|nr:acetate/propionate family kinase [Granulicella sibirica]RXH57907.1 Acetate kinase [Granulicella sibirica]
MPRILALNPGSNSLKFDLVDASPDQKIASEGRKLLTGTVDDIGKQTKLIVQQDGKTIAEQEGDFKDFSAATERVVDFFQSHTEIQNWKDLDQAAVRVVHGGDTFQKAERYTREIREEIERREEQAPLHNANSLKIIDVLQRKSPDLPVAVTFDTAFHHTIPEHAWRYPIAREVADSLGIRKFGFHGLSHRYMLEQYAHLNNKQPEDISIVTLHLESGSSACAIQNGKSIDTSMGFTPLEGLMMGTRCGSIDTAILPYLAEKQKISPEDALKILEKKSGLLGISGVSLDTRILRKRDDAASKLAIQMFGYRVRHFVGAYLAILGEAEAVVFGGGIGENTPEVRTEVTEGLRGWGIAIDQKKNEITCAGDTHIHNRYSTLGAWVIHVEEGMQLAHECVRIS